MPMTPELTDLLSLRNLILYASAILMTFIVSLARVGRERGVQRAEGKPLTTNAEMLWDALNGSLAGIALLLLQDSIYPLPIKAALALAMFYGYLGPTAWDLFAEIAQGHYTVSKVSKKEEPNDGKTNDP